MTETTEMAVVAPAPKLTLRELTEQLTAWRDTFEGTDPDSPDAQLILAKWEQVQSLHASKADQFVAMVRYVASEQEGLKADKQRFERRQRSYERIEQDMRSYCRDLMVDNGATQIKGRANTISLCDGKDRLQITDADAIPRDLKTEIPEQIIPARLVPDVEAIEAALRRGEDVPGARLIPVEPFIRIT